MNIPNKKLKTGFEMPVFGMGTWQMGGREERDKNNDDGADISAIKMAIETGVTHLDTAEFYANGHTEELVGEAIKNFDREKLFLVSKVKSENFAYENVLRACENSLERMGVKYLDLYLIHWYDDSLPLKETIRAMDELVARGLVKNIGVSNFTPERLAEAQGYSKNKIVCDQVHYNLIFREPERKRLLEYCQQNDVMLVAYRPLEKGLFSRNPLEILQKICSKYQKTPAQVAINWLISQNNVVAIAKSSNLKHLEENLGAVGWQMEKEDIESLRRDFTGQKNVSNCIELG